MTSEFSQIEWDAGLAEECRQLVRLAMREDLGLSGGQDITTAALVDATKSGRAAIVAREPLVVAGLPVAELVFAEYGGDLILTSQISDGDEVEAGQCIARITGSAALLLSAERVILNFLGRLCGIATQTGRYVDAVAGTGAGIYDTRKTTPAWRRLEKYAVRCGGGMNHRTGLYDAILIKDNHLAFGRAGKSDPQSAPAEAVRKARAFSEESDSGCLIEIEVDTLDQLQNVLGEQPDIVLLDNMGLSELRQAVALRDRMAPSIVLDASGGITIENVRKIALTGVERISIGALTHSARWVDIGLDWLE